MRYLEQVFKTIFGALRQELDHCPVNYLYLSHDNLRVFMGEWELRYCIYYNKYFFIQLIFMNTYGQIIDISALSL